MPDRVTWSQEALTWRHQVSGPVDAITILRAAWDGSAAAGEKIATDDFYVDEFATSRLAPAWALADQLVRRLPGLGDVYVTVVVAGGRFPRRKDAGYIVMRRGPVLPGVDDDHVASLGRELKRALGYSEAEP